MEENWKKFHFQEMKWLVCFPNCGNEGKKYLFYSVVFTDLNKGNLAAQVNLGDVLDTLEFEKNLPHTVGFFKSNIDQRKDFKCEYLEIRIIRSIEDFWKFLNDLDL